MIFDSSCNSSTVFISLNLIANKLTMFNIQKLKVALDKFNIIPQLFQKSWDFYTIRSDNIS